MSDARDTSLLFEDTARHDPGGALSASERTRIEDTFALIPPGTETLLEVGCGGGELLNRVPVHHAFGTDLARRGLRSCTRPVVRSSALALPFQDDAVDVVLCAEVLEHLDPEDLPSAVAELTRVARRSVLITVPNEEQLLRFSHRCPRCNEIFHLHGHQSSLNEEMLRGLFPPRARIVSERSWRVRPFQRHLLRWRTFGLGLWKHSRHTRCPHCGNQDFENHEKRIGYRIVEAMNDLLHPFKTKWNWLLMRVDLEDTADQPRRNSPAR